MDTKVKAKNLVAKMTLEEKAGLCSGMDFWRLKTVEQLGLETIMVADGPHGLRKQKDEQDNLGLGNSVPAVCFPTASALACSFDRDLAYEVGTAIAEECLQENISVILGPGANQKRSPLCGRNFEYFSEDPILSGELASSMINGVQSQGVGTSLKHFAVNNQEKRRMTVNAIVDERTLRETYLRAYEIAVKKSKPWTVMCSYNRINGDYSSENAYLLTKILREEWGFDGLVMSDWGAVCDRALGVKAGMDLEMPSSSGINDAKIITAIKNNTLTQEDLNQTTCRVTELILKGMANKKKDFHYDVEAHHQLAVRAAEQSAVLLKNEDKILPGNLGQRAAVIGAFAKKPRYQGAGSSKINPIKVDIAFDAFTLQGLEFTYAQGYVLKKSSKKNENEEQKEAELIAEACEASKGKDIVYIFAGLPEGYESEGFDRADLSLPQSHNKLIEAVADCNSNVVVVLMGGSVMALPWISKVKGIIVAYLGGEGCGTAAVNLLLGKAIPCGKLAETWPYSINDTPAYHYFPGGRTTVEYREGIYVGYRYYEAAGKPVLFPFGYGLSYTSFAYSNLRIEKETCDYGDQFTINFQITNTGEVEAKETALIFVAHKNELVYLPNKELREFIKVSLQPGETKQVTVVLDTNTFGYYNTLIKDWYAESGDYTVLVGSSADKCSLKKVIRLNSPKKPQPDLRDKIPSYYHLSNKELEITEEEFCLLYGKEIPKNIEKPTKPYQKSNTLADVEHTFIGKKMISIIGGMVNKASQDDEEDNSMMMVMMKEMPLYSLVTLGEGRVSEKMLDGILDLLNGHYLKGMRELLSKK